MNKIRITHVITGLSTGGAENVLSQLVSRMDRQTFENSVVSLVDFGPVARTIAEAEIPVSTAGFPKTGFQIGPIIRLVREIRRSAPHIVQTWMYHGDLIGGIAARVFTGVPVIWNLRQSNFDPIVSKKSTIGIAKICARLSRTLPSAIVCGSNAAYDCHIRFGYSPDQMVVLPNGFDTKRFKPDPQCRAALQKELGLENDDFIVGLVARFDPQKDHTTFLAAAARLAQQMPNAKFVLCGERIDRNNADLWGLVEYHGLGGRVHLLGLREHMERFYPALDVLALSSAYGEGAPNVLGEAMSCGVPCVTTDIGDSATIVGRTGETVSCRDSEALAAALRRVAEMPEEARRRMGAEARSRIVDEFPIHLVVERYGSLYRRVYSQRYAS